MLANSHQDSVIKADEIETSVVRVRLVGANIRQRCVRKRSRSPKPITLLATIRPSGEPTCRTMAASVTRASTPVSTSSTTATSASWNTTSWSRPAVIPAESRLSSRALERLRIDPASGDLIVSMIAPGSVSGIASWGQSELRLLRPVTYQDIDGLAKHVTSSYKLLAGNKIGFTVGKYDHARPLVIDPVLVYSTYLGGSGNSTGAGDQGTALPVDDRGHAYVVGTTYSVDFPLTQARPPGSKTKRRWPAPAPRYLWPN